MTTEEHLYSEIKALRKKILEVEAENAALKERLKESENVMKAMQELLGTVRVKIEGVVS